jgi:hypothetical protein
MRKIMKGAGNESDVIITILFLIAVFAYLIFTLYTFLKEKYGTNIAIVIMIGSVIGLYYLYIFLSPYVSSWWNAPTRFWNSATWRGSQYNNNINTNTI